MKRRRIVLLLALAVVALGLVLFWPRGPKEPVHKGKPLSKWIEEAMLVDQQGRLDGVIEAREVVREIGTNALPWLMAEFTRVTPRWHNSFNELTVRAGLKGVRFRTDDERLGTVSWGLQLLGTNIIPALPVLAAQLGNPKRATLAMNELKKVGPAAAPGLVQQIVSGNSLAVTNASLLVSQFGINGEAGLPILLQLVEHTNSGVRVAALEGLDYYIYTEPERKAAAIVRCLTTTNAGVRARAGSALVRMAPRAGSAIPEIRTLLTNANPAVASAASNALFHIDPPALPASGP